MYLAMGLHLSRLGSTSDMNHLQTRRISHFTPFAEVMARRNALSIDNHLSSAYSKGSKGGTHTASNTRGRSHRGAFGAQEGCNLRATLKKCKEGGLMTGKEVSHLEGTFLRYQTGSGLSMSEGLETPAACNHADFLKGTKVEATVNLPQRRR